MLAGAGRAILLQIADPRVGHGVADHSDFVQRPQDRLRATLTYVYAIVYGSDEQVAAVRRAVNRAHAPVRRNPDDATKGYNAFDPGSQLWVVATLYDTAVTVYEQVHGPLDDETADRMYRDYARIGTALQLPAIGRPSPGIGHRTWIGFDPMKKPARSPGACCIRRVGRHPCAWRCRLPAS